MGIQYLSEAARLERKIQLQSERIQNTEALIKVFQDTVEGSSPKIMNPLRNKLARQIEALKTTQTCLNIIHGLGDFPAQKGKSK